MALYQLSEWHLKYAQDVEAARQALEKVMELLPDSEQALQAQQRIAHLASTEHLLNKQDRPPIRMQAGAQNIGLLKDSSHLRPAEEDPAQKADEYIKHLEQYPQDAEAREKLAVIYADFFHRLDLAAEQLELLIQNPLQPAKQVVHWLNLLADLQIAHGADYEAAKQTLERIVDLYPARSYADHARQRIDRLKLELKGREKSQSLQLGTYEQRLGLKKKS